MRQATTGTKAINANQEEKEESPIEGVSLDQVKAWKKKYGTLFAIRVCNKDYIFRKLKRSEYTNIMTASMYNLGIKVPEINNEENEELTAEQKSQINDIEGEILYKRQELFAKTVTLFPRDITQDLEDNSGLATTLADETIAHSGFRINKKIKTL